MHVSRFHPFGLPLPFYSTEGAAPGGADATKTADAAAAAAAATSGDATKDSGADAGSKTITALDGGDDKGDPPAPADFPADWREKLAMGADGKPDAKVLERLKRMPAPTDLLKSYLAADAKIAKGKAGADDPMPDPEKDPDGAKAWRAARDIPDDPTGYELPKDVQAKLIEEDKPVIAAYAERMHKAGMPRKVVAEGVSWYTDMMVERAEVRNAEDKKAVTATRDALRDKWGADFTANEAMAKAVATEATPGIDWYTARLPDGRAIGNIPEVVAFLAEMGRMKFGDERFAGGSRANETATRKEELLKIMREDNDTWERSPALRKEYRDILAAEDKRAGRQ